MTNAHAPSNTRAPVARTVPRYWESLDFPALWDEFPPPPDFNSSAAKLSRDELRALQERRFLQQVERAWRIPFYQRHWRNAGMGRGDIKGMDDLHLIPSFSVHDLRDSIDRNPPWGDFLGVDPAVDAPMPLVLQTSGGTTGLPRAMLYSPRDREVMNIITGRRLHMQGVRPFDLVQVVLSTGLTNGGFLAREGIWKYTGAVPVMTGSGAQTPTRRQLEIMRAWKTNHLVGFSAYLRKLGEVCRDELGVDPRSLGLKGLIAHLGTDDREALERLWGAPAYDTYGTNEFGSIAADCEHRSGMHVFEDAFLVEINDRETGRAVAEGQEGVLYVTSLFKHLAPMIRFNMNDISSWVHSSTPCPCGCTHRRISKILGRSDNMVKLRGTNVFPEAIGALIAEHQGSNGEYVCIVERDASGREDMTVRFELKPGQEDPTAVEKQIATRLKEALGVKFIVRSAAVGELDALTGLSSHSKIKRLIDKR